MLNLYAPQRVTMEIGLELGVRVSTVSFMRVSMDYIFVSIALAVAGGIREFHNAPLD